MGFCGTESTIEDFNGLKSYQTFTQHMNTVTSNDALVLGLRQRRPDLEIYGLNPGIIKTGIRANVYGNSLKAFFLETMIGWFTPSTMQYAQRIKNVIAAESIPKNATFFNAYGEPIQVSHYLSDEKNIMTIWNQTDTLIEYAWRKYVGYLYN